VLSAASLARDRLVEFGLYVIKCSSATPFGWQSTKCFNMTLGQYVRPMTSLCNEFYIYSCLFSPAMVFQCEMLNALIAMNELLIFFLLVWGATIIVRSCEVGSYTGQRCGWLFVRTSYAKFCACETSLCNYATATVPGAYVAANTLGASTRPNRFITGGSFMLSASFTTTLIAVACVQWYSAGFM
jgi:hypothetical protein